MRLGPSRIFTPAFPNLPTLAGLVHTGALAGQPGILNAAGLNHSVSVCPAAGYILTPGTTSGLPLETPVFDGSGPENDGVKYWPACEISTQLVGNPPTITGKIHSAFKKKRCPLRSAARRARQDKIAAEPREHCSLSL